MEITILYGNVALSGQISQATARTSFFSLRDAIIRGIQIAKPTRLRVEKWKRKKGEKIGACGARAEDGRGGRAERRKSGYV